MEWRFKNSVLGTYEIENAIGYAPYKRYVSGFKYLDTSICYNNDLYLKDVLGSNKDMRVISKIPPQMTTEYEFMLSNHLRCLGRKKIDIMLIHNSRSEWIELAKMLNNDNRIVETGVSNFSINDIELYKSTLGFYPKYNEMEINPLYYDKELIEFCHKNDIKIIAYAILGGKYNARRNIATYTLQYLTTLAGINAEFVICRSDNACRLNSLTIYLEDMNNKINYSLFDIESRTNKSINPTSYSYPEFYTRCIYPTNSDGILPFGEYTLSKGFIEDEGNKEDSLYLNDLPIPNYEFISDYRAYYRYKLDELIHNKTGIYPEGVYSFPSTYIAMVKKSSLIRKLMKSEINEAHLCSVNFITKDGNLSKVNNGGKLYIESMSKK